LPTTREDVANFLIDFKSAMSLGFYQMLGREKNLQGIIDLGLTGNQAKEVIASLSPDNYAGGPKPDDNDENRHVWEFGQDVGGTEAYIKLQLRCDPRRAVVRIAVVYSFHPAEYPIKYPLRGGRP
jgi:hypothetical protein